MNTTKDPLFLQLFVKHLNLYLLPVIVIVGTIGNILSFYVLIKSPQLRHQSANVYLAFLSLVDTGFLCCLLIVWIDFLKMHTVFSLNGFCQIIPYVTYVFGFLSVYTVVSFTVERFVVTYNPLKRYTLCTRRRAKINLATLSIIALIFYSFPLYMSAVIHHGTITACQPRPHFIKAAYILSSIDTVVTLLLPSVAILVLNVAIFVKIRQTFSAKETRRLGRHVSVSLDDGHVKSLKLQSSTMSSQCRHGSIHQPSQHRAQVRTTVTLVILSTVFVVLNLPSHAPGFMLSSFL